MQLNRYQKALEFDKVLQLISDHAVMEDTVQRILRIRPADNYYDVKKALSETDCALQYICRYGAPTFVKVHNPEISLKRAEVGSALNTKELLRIGEVLRVIRGLYQWQERLQAEQMPHTLDEYFHFLIPQKYLEEHIFSCILAEDEIADSASSKLLEVRRKIRNAQAQAKNQLDAILRSPVHEKHLREQIVTMRDGRYVVPVKAEYRTAVKGLVHDVSSSGATVFIEPAAVVEANNKIRLLELEEQKEIERILAALSAEAGDAAKPITDSYYCMVELDCIFARAKYAEQTDSCMPVLQQGGATVLKKARHPLLDLKQCIPVDIEIGDTFDTLVITGPNTGGKTVSLKTLGLLCLMAAAGLLIPCAPQSSVALYRDILVDIGDEQSIEQSLSTFSAHMKNIISILHQADDKTLVLLDELGSGTDPVEGAALAVSILETLRKKGSYIAATTHYAEIKMFALNTAGVENACCEFDVETLSPTYKLLIGVPGRSNAFAISQRLGLDIRVIDNAKSKLSAESTKFEDVMGALEQSRQEMEQQRQETEQMRQETAQMQVQVKQKLENINSQKETEIQKAQAKAKQLVSDIKAQSDKILEELDEIRRKKDHPDFSNMLLNARKNLKSQLKQIENKADPVKAHQRTYQLPRPLKAGDDVLIVDIQTKGVVLSPPDSHNMVTVQAGIMKTKVKLEQLELIVDDSAKKQAASYVKRSLQQHASRASDEINLIGKNVEEALMELDFFIDNCAIGHIPSIRIVHGKGAGILRNAVGSHLKRHKQIKTFRLGVYGEGENGVTIAELK